MGELLAAAPPAGAVYLAHRSGGRQAFDAVDLLAEGVAALHPGLEVRHGVRVEGGGLPLRRRLIVGNAAVLRWPEGPCGPRWRPPVPELRAAAEVWVVGRGAVDVEQDLVAARQAGVPVRDLSPRAQRIYAEAGAAVRARRWAEVTDAVVKRELGVVLDESAFRGARAVLTAAALAESWLVGGGAIDYERRLSGTAPTGTGALAFRQAAETTALRLVQAQALLRSAGLSEVEARAARAREVEDLTWRRVALRLGWSDDDASERRAERTVRRALGKIAAALRRREEDHERQA